MPTSPLDYIPQLKTGKEAGGLPPRLLKQTATSLEGALRGELPEDVQNLLRQQAAEYGVASGAPGSQFQSYAGLRNLGLTSLDRIQGAERLLAPQFISPAQREDLALRAGTTRAGLAQAQAELAQQRELEQARLTQQGTLTREQLANQAAIAAAGESGANYRASLGLSGGGTSGGGRRSSGSSSFVSGGTGSGVGYDPNAVFGAPIVAQGTGPLGGITYESPASTDFDFSSYYDDAGGGSAPVSDDFWNDYYDYGY